MMMMMIRKKKERDRTHVMLIRCLLKVIHIIIVKKY